MIAPFRVYVGGSSDDIARAETVSGLLACEDGVEVVSTWIGNIRKVGAANPRESSQKERFGWAEHCLVEVRSADLYWLLAPQIGHGRGAYAELACAHEHGIPIVCSGDSKQSIFGALGYEAATDLLGLQLVLSLRKLHAAKHARPAAP